MTILLSQPYSFCQLGKRENQEDCRYPNSNCPQDYDPFFIVCDGVGGCEDGDIASTAVCKGLASYLERVDWSSTFTTEDLGKALGAAYQTLDNAAEHGSSDMATTMTLVCFHKGGCTMAHIGDSRIFQIRPATGIIYCSEDHSTVNELVHAGLLSPERVDTHPNRNMIERYMAPAIDGEEQSNATCYHTQNVQAGDYFFLCTDGVLERVSEQTLTEILCGDGSDTDKCKHIADICQNSKDNNTAYLLHVSDVRMDLEADINPEGQEAITDDQYTEITRRISNCPPTIEEVAAENDSFGKNVIRFFRKLF